MAGTPGTLDQLLTPRARELLAHPTGPLAAALRVADGVCTDWTPRVPIRLYAAKDDEQAVNANSEHCRAALDAPLINLGTPDYGGSRHLGSQQAATADVVRWFSELTATGAVPRP